jgi:hypothetical protein
MHRLNDRKSHKKLWMLLTGIILSIVGVLALSACDSQPTSQDKEASTRQSSYDRLTAR